MLEKSSQRPGNASAAEPSRELSSAAREAAIRRLRTSNRLLCVVLVAVVVRAIISGPGLSVIVVAIVFALLLVASLLLTRQGRRLERRSRPAAPTGKP
jgi:Flp pilus assembly protein TadB